MGQAAGQAAGQAVRDGWPGRRAASSPDRPTGSSAIPIAATAPCLPDGKGGQGAVLPGRRQRPGIPSRRVTNPARRTSGIERVGLQPELRTDCCCDVAVGCRRAPSRDCIPVEGLRQMRAGRQRTDDDGPFNVP